MSGADIIRRPDVILFGTGESSANGILLYADFYIWFITAYLATHNLSKLHRGLTSTYRNSLQYSHDVHETYMKSARATIAMRSRAQSDNVAISTAVSVPPVMHLPPLPPIPDAILPESSESSTDTKSGTTGFMAPHIILSADPPRDPGSGTTDASSVVAPTTTGSAVTIAARPLAAVFDASRILKTAIRTARAPVVDADATGGATRGKPRTKRPTNDSRTSASDNARTGSGDAKSSSSSAAALSSNDSSDSRNVPKSRTSTPTRSGATAASRAVSSSSTAVAYSTTIQLTMDAAGAGAIPASTTTAPGVLETDKLALKIRLAVAQTRLAPNQISIPSEDFLRKVFIDWWLSSGASQSATQLSGMYYAHY